MTETRRKGPPHITEEEMMKALQEWEASLPTPPTLLDAVRSGELNIFAAYLTRNFRIAAKDAVRRRERVVLLRDLALAAIGDAEEAEQFLRAPSEFLHRTPLEAAVDSSQGWEEALKKLTPHVRKVAMRFVELIEKAWHLDELEAAALLGCNVEEMNRWRSDAGTMPDEVVLRISLLLAVHRAIGVLLPREETPDPWVKAHTSWHRLYGVTAIDYMIAEGLPGIRQVRDYLEAEIWSV